MAYSSHNIWNVLGWSIADNYLFRYIQERGAGRDLDNLAFRLRRHADSVGNVLYGQM